MKRDYVNGVSDSATFFIGHEVEHTPAYGLRTLFVIGLQDVEEINAHYNANNCEHIFFGANHSYNPDLERFELWKEFQPWDDMMLPFLKKGILCTLDIPLYAAEDTLEMTSVENNNFIAQLRVPVPYATTWNYNTMVKIDDKDFNATNPGVWAHSLHDLMDRSVYTDWREYGQDTIIGDQDG